MDWLVGYMASPCGEPEELVPAQVPGAVQLDWARAKGWPDYRYDLNFLDYRWMEDCCWMYRCRTKLQEVLPGEWLELLCGGIDYEFDIMVDRALLLHQEGMFRPVRLDLTRYAGRNITVEVVIYPVPKDRSGQPGTREEARQSVKPAAAYGWDWHPRLIPLGIWEDLCIVKRPAGHLTTAGVRYTLTGELDRADIVCSSSVCGPGEPEWTVEDPDGTVIYTGRGKKVTCSILNPQLWWCNGCGKPALYRWRAVLPNGDMKCGRVGFRSVRLCMNEGAWEEPSDFPKTRSVPPVTLVLNNRPVFAKGSNFVNPDVFPGEVTRQTYEPLIARAREAHMNMLRCWGGAYINKDSFFELCDEQGIMVWQDFPLACNDYYDSRHYLKILRSEAEAIIRRVKDHPSLVLWCGGNELFNNWSGMDDQKLALRLLNKLCLEMDPKRPFIMTSPLMGMGHGGYLFRYHNGDEVFAAMQKAHCSAYTEFGIPSISGREYLKKYIPEEKLEPFADNASLRAHHAFGAWFPGDTTWSCIDLIEDYFGKQTELAKLADKSQWLQGEGLKAVFEEARRQQPYCSMALSWCLNEPWPTAANNSLINYPAEPKPSYEAVKQALRPILASARIQKFVYASGEMFEAQIWILNDSKEETACGTVEICLEIGGMRRNILRWDYPPVEAGKNLLGPTVHHVLPECDDGELILHLAAGEMSSSYRLLYKGKRTKGRSVKVLYA